MSIVLRLKARIQKRGGSAFNKTDQYHDSRINAFLMKNASSDDIMKLVKTSV
jgi:hypothetical protein